MKTDSNYAVCCFGISSPCSSLKTDSFWLIYFTSSMRKIK